MHARCWILSLAVALPLATAGSTQAQAPADPEPAAAETDWYYGRPAPKPKPIDIIHQKAQIRAAQRMSRMASMQWYGMSNQRPTATATPYTSIYSPVWQMPGGRPFAWNVSSRTPVVIVRPSDDEELLRR